jgi:hypothetical protein
MPYRASPAKSAALGGQPPSANPQVMQWRQPISTSLRHSGHCVTDWLCPQWGQKFTMRPTGSVPPQKLHRSPPGTVVSSSSVPASGPGGAGWGTRTSSSGSASSASMISTLSIGPFGAAGAGAAAPDEGGS